MATEILRPTGVGDETNIPTVTGAATHWEAVDEVTPDEATTTVSQTGGALPSDDTDLYLIANSGVGTGTINKITIYVRVRTGNSFGSAKVRTRIKTGGSTFESADLTYTSGEGWHYETQEYAVNPDTTNAWSWAEIDALQAGLHAYKFETKGFQVTTCTQVYVEVDYVAAGTNFQINIGDAWKEVPLMKINIGDVWKDVASAQINIGDSWKTIF